jgi:hypothetical protein
MDGVNRMRAAALPLLAAIGVLAGCATDSQPVSQSAPSVSYRVPANNDVSQANANAARYCQQYNTSAQLQNLQPGPSGNVAVYTCTGAPGAVAGVVPAYGAQPGAPPPGNVQQPGYGATLPPVQCADPLHQDRPGGTDYYGPPVAECLPR